MPWNDEFECMPVEELKKFQLKKLKETVAWVAEKVPFYQKKFKKIGIKAGDIKSLQDVTQLPFTVKTDLRDNYPFGLCAVPLEEVVRVHASSGTTGKPITGPYTAEDMQQWIECMARNLYAAGIRKEDVVQNAYGHGLFTGGLGFHQGATAIGCTVVPTGAGMTERQITIMQDFKSDVLFATPSYALTIAERAEEMNIDIRKFPLRVGVFGAEPWTEAMRQEIEERMGIKAQEAFGLTELCGPGVAYDAADQNGLYINEDHFLAEIVDPQTLESLPEGEKGELIFTSLQRRAMPMIRYRTKDITRLWREPGHEGRIAHAELAHRGVDARDPQRAEGALAVAAVAVGVLPRLHHRLLGDAVNVLATAAITLGLGENLLVARARRYTTFYSRHLLSPYA